MPYRPSRRQDAKLGIALILSLVCGVASFSTSFAIAYYFLLLTGLVKIRIPWPAPTKLEGIGWLYGCFGLSILLGVLIAFVVFRVIIRSGDSRMPEARSGLRSKNERDTVS
jgi:hypothetical protein